MKNKIIIVLIIIIVLAAGIYFFQKKRTPMNSFKKGRSFHQTKQSFEKCIDNQMSKSFICIEGYAASLTEEMKGDISALTLFLEKSPVPWPYKRAVYLGYGIGLKKYHSLKSLSLIAKQHFKEGFFQLIDGWSFAATAESKSAKDVYMTCQRIEDEVSRQVCLFGLGRRIYILNRTYNESLELFDNPSVKMGYGFASRFAGRQETSDDLKIYLGINIAKAFIEAANSNTKSDFKKCLDNLPSHPLFCYSSEQ